ncbi:MAG: DUF2812 domain-containing protein [Spirochaetota bacterium]
MAIMRKFRWFWAWDDEKEENWLRGMAQEGWHLRSVTLPGRYVFERGQPCDDVYRLDYFTGPKGTRSDYLQLFMDAGWDYRGEMNGWQYFSRNATDGETLEIFTDTESKSRKYKRILLYLIIFLPACLNFVLISHRSEFPWMQALTVFMSAALFFYVYAMLRLLVRIGQLKKRL